jgi:hypothetical protein
MSAGLDRNVSDFDCGTLSQIEEAALSFLRDAVAGMRKARAVTDLSYVEGAILAAGGSRVGGETGANSSTFILNGSRFTLRQVVDPVEKVEVSFLGGNSC